MQVLAKLHAKARDLRSALRTATLISEDSYKGIALWQIVLIALEEAGVRGIHTLYEVYETLFPGILMASGDPDAQPDAEGDVKPQNYQIVSVFYGTDRAPRYGKTSTHFGPNRGSALQFGTCKVSIPTDHKVGALESPHWFLNLFGVSSFFESRQKHVSIISIDPKEKQSFLAELRKKIDQSGKKEAFLFIHGFNVSFADACRRTAQISYDLQFTGAPILYSWPSQAELTPTSYMTDGESVKRAIPHLRKFLKHIRDNSGAQTIHLIAHSMGNRVLAWALKDIAYGLQAKQAPPAFNEIVLTAPDIDAEVFKDLAKEIQGAGHRLTLYASSKDKALTISKSLQGDYPRAGDAGKNIMVIPGVDTVDVSLLDTGLTGHSYYGDNKSVLADLFYLLRGMLPDDRSFLKPKERNNLRYWEFQP